MNKLTHIIITITEAVFPPSGLVGATEADYPLGRLCYFTLAGDESGAGCGVFCGVGCGGGCDEWLVR